MNNMKTLAVVTLIIGLCGAANAATLNLQMTVTDAELDRIVAAFQVRANASVNGLATRPQVLQFIRARTIDGIRADVLQFERQRDIEAVPAPTPINPL